MQSEQGLTGVRHCTRLLIEAFFLHNLDDSLILCKIVTKMSENRNGNSQGPAQKKNPSPLSYFLQN